MKVLKILLLLLLLTTLFVSFGCQSMQSGNMRENYRVDQRDWRSTGTGFYTPEYIP